MRTVLTARIEPGTGESREIFVRDDDRILASIWDALIAALASGEAPRTSNLLSGIRPPGGKRRRGVTDAPPAEFSEADFDVVTINDERRLEELVFTEQKVVGRKGRPVRSYRVDAAVWAPAFRLMKLIFPDVAASWEKPQAWWMDGEMTTENESGTERVEHFDAAGFGEQGKNQGQKSDPANGVEKHG